MLRKVQNEVKEWSARNFGEHPSWHPLLGMGEEVGEINHAFLKREQGIRGDSDKHTEAIKDGVADLVIFLCDFCNREGIDLQSELESTWSKVQQRDWKANPSDADGKVS